jgi:hypothetical protein
VVVAHGRQRPQDFTRHCKLTFATVALVILRGHKLSLQTALNKVFHALGQVFRVPSNGAFCHARQKLKPAVLSLLSRVVVQSFYDQAAPAGELELWRGHRLVGADGSFLNLPDTEETRAKFSLQTNQHSGAECVQALCCLLYDLRNALGLALSLTKRQGEVGLLLNTLWAATQADDVLVLDRAYADYRLLAYAVARRRHVIVRLARGRFSVCEDFWHNGLSEQFIELPLPLTPATRAFVREHGLPETLRLRLVRVRLPHGATEVLLTTLLDHQAYPAAEFKQVYGWRWGEETFFDRFKNIFEVERFSGSSVRAIEQDVHGVLLLANLERVLAQADEQVLQAQAAERQAQRLPQVNRAVSYVALVERVVPLLSSGQPHEQVLAELHHLFRTNPTRIRPDRQVPRSPLRYAHRLRFHKYVKKLLA